MSDYLNQVFEIVSDASISLRNTSRHRFVKNPLDKIHSYTAHTKLQPKDSKTKFEESLFFRTYKSELTLNLS